MLHLINPIKKGMLHNTRIRLSNEFEDNKEPENDEGINVKINLCVKMNGETENLLQV